MSDGSKTHRIGIFGPFMLLVLAFAGWSAYWFVAARALETRINTQQTALISQGYQISADPWHVSGYPFRMFVALDHLTVIAPSGHGLSAPRFEAEANAYALDKWVMVAPQGLTLYRGHHNGADWGTLAVSGKSLKASASNLTKPIGNIAIEGSGLTLVASDPSHPFAFDTAELVEAYLRPTVGHDDSADFLLRVSGARGQPQSLAGQLAQDKPLSLHAEGALSRVSSFAAGAQGQATARWHAAGGAVSGLHVQLLADDLDVEAKSDNLTFGPDNRAVGHMDVAMTGALQPIGVMAALHLISAENLTLATPLLDMTLVTKGTQKFPLDFKDGGAYIGALKVSDAPILP